MLVHPGLRLLLELRLVQLAGAHQHLTILAVDHVPVYIDVGEGVVEPDLLDLGIGREGRPGLPEADVVNGARVGHHVGSGEVEGGVARDLSDPIQTEGPAGGLDVVGYVLAFRRDLVGRHLVLLDDGRVGLAGQRPREEHDRDGYRGKPPALVADVEDEDRRRDERHYGQEG